MAIWRVSRLQKRILWLLVAEHRRTQGGASSSHYELVKALGGDKRNISHSLRTLEERGWIVILPAIPAESASPVIIGSAALAFRKPRCENTP